MESHRISWLFAGVSTFFAFGCLVVGCSAGNDSPGGSTGGGAGTEGSGGSTMTGSGGSGVSGSGGTGGTTFERRLWWNGRIRGQWWRERVDRNRWVERQRWVDWQRWVERHGRVERHGWQSRFRRR
jgi:hypothetical protein